MKLEGMKRNGGRRKVGEGKSGQKKAEERTRKERGGKKERKALEMEKNKPPQYMKLTLWRFLSLGRPSFISFLINNIHRFQYSKGDQKKVISAAKFYMCLYSL